MSTVRKPDLDVENISNIDIRLMTLRKPTELKKVMDSVPKPTRAVPKHGLPMWYRLGLDSKLPVPNLPKDRLTFARGKIGEDIRRVGLGKDGPQPSFDTSDPYCHQVTFNYDPLHDPHLAHHFAQKPIRDMMKKLGYCTSDGRAVCSLKDFNQYRKYLYKRYMDRIQGEIKKMDEQARDDLVLRNVEVAIQSQLKAFMVAERGREKMEKHARMHADESEEKKRLAKEQEKKVQERIKNLEEFNEKQRLERTQKSLETQQRIKQRITAANELEIRRKITMVREWRNSEKRRLNRLRQVEKEKSAKKLNTADEKWLARVKAQNRKIQEEAALMKLYSEEMQAGIQRRKKRAQIHAYCDELTLQRIKHENWHKMHGEAEKRASLYRKMGLEFEKTKRGMKGMSMKLAMKMAREAMDNATSTSGDRLMTLGQARAKMDIQTVMPAAPLKLIDNVLDVAVMEFARRRVHLLLKHVEQVVHDRAAVVFFRREDRKKRLKASRWSVQAARELAEQNVNLQGRDLSFGEVVHINATEYLGADTVVKRCKDRPPTPVPSQTKLAEVTFVDRIEDLPEPTTEGSYMPERRKLIEMVNASAKLLARAVSAKVQEGMDLILGMVTMPSMRHPMEWGEAVEGLSDAVVNNRVNPDCPDLRRTSVFLAQRVLHSLHHEMKEIKKKEKAQRVGDVAENRLSDEDFYTPIKEGPEGGAPALPTPPGGLAVQQLS